MAKPTHLTHQATSEIQLDTSTSSSLYTLEGCHCPGTHPLLPQSQLNLHHIH